MLLHFEFKSAQNNSDTNNDKRQLHHAMWAQQPIKPKSGTLSNGKWNIPYSIRHLLFVVQAFYFVSTSYQYVLCDELSYSITQLFVQLLYADNQLKIQIESSSVQKMLCKQLPTDQRVHVTLQQSIIRSITKCINNIVFFLLHLQ